MKKVISIGKQDFAYIRENDCFYVDKTSLIKEWWEGKDDVTLITRPRRFGKTLNMSMLNCFFSNQYQNRGDLFEGLFIWEDETYRKLQGTYPVIFLSFADVKQTNGADAIKQVKRIISDVYESCQYLVKWENLGERQRRQFFEICPQMDDVTAQNALKDLTKYLAKYYGKNVIILLDEYDTPMQEAYVHGYWDVFTEFMRSLFNSTFKTNPYLERAMMTGITRVSKESVFSDLNNMTVITTTSNRYADCFGFTEQEVFSGLDAYGLAAEKEEVKLWYDGFTFGEYRDIYNPWSITNFLQERQLRPYWASTSSNGLVNQLIRTAPAQTKEQMEILLQEKTIVVSFDEQMVFQQLGQDDNAIWSLLLASGYLRVEKVEYRGLTREPWYHLCITNLETYSMFAGMCKGWFGRVSANYQGFIKALLDGNLKEMNVYMNEVALTTFSSFDTGTHPSANAQPERFYHGFVLGMLVDLRDDYDLRSNRESGYGRYDVMLIPHEKHEKAIVMEFKVHDAQAEKTMEDTVEAAKRQIREKKYDTELIEQGVKRENIRHYGFAFAGKKVLIG